MKLSNSYFFTKKENSKNEESNSANLLIRAGMIKKVGSGIFCFLPLGLRVFRKIENIIREEMNEIGSLELTIPALLPEEYYVNSGRRDVFGEDMFSLDDRSGRKYVLGPTHEELFVEVCREVIKSYKDMPISLYQITNKYRDEARSRYGLIRTREFVMKDAYSFDKDISGLDKSYSLMFNAYKKIFDRIGLNYTIVEASSGAMGGLLSEEFQAITDIGEDILVLCDKCALSTNLEICECRNTLITSDEKKLEKEIFYTPNCGKIEDISEKYKINPQDMCKTMIYKIDNNFYGFVIRGDREINENKISRLFNTKNVELASFLEDKEVTGAEVGFAGPIGLDIPIIIDYEVLNMKNFLVGANKTDYHYKNVNLEDFNYFKVADIRNISIEDVCPKCGAKLTFKHGIEVGNTFKLGTKYSEAMNLYYADHDNNMQPVVMGCYGIGIARIMAAIVEQNYDEDGIIFPKEIAPFDVAIIVVDIKDEKQMLLANKIYDFYQKKKIDILLDDRNIRVGIKFKDIDLIGIPKRIVVGKKSDQNIVEIKLRNSKNNQEINIDDLLNN